MTLSIQNPDILTSLTPQLQERRGKLSKTIIAILQQDPNNMSYSELQLLLAMMLQTLLTTTAKSMATIVERQKENAAIGALGIAVAKRQLDEAKTERARIAEEEYEIRHPPWWKILLAIFIPVIGIQLIVSPMVELDKANNESVGSGLQFADILFKYVLPVVMIVVMGIFLGPEAAVVGALLFALTAIPVKDGKSALECTEDSIVHLIAVSMQLTDEQEKILSACVKIVLAVVIIVVCASVGSGSAAESEIENTAQTVEKTAVNLTEEATEDFEALAMNEMETVEEETAMTSNRATENTTTTPKKNMVGRACGWNAASSTLTNNTAMQDLVYGIIKTTNPKMTKEEALRRAKIAAMVLNTIIAVATMVGSGISSYSAATDPTVETAASSFSKGLSKAIPSISRALSIATLATAMGQAVADVQLAFQAKSLADFKAAITRMEAMLNWCAGIQQMIDNSDKILNLAEKSVQETFDTLLGHDPRYAQPTFTEAHAMQNAQHV
jgi:hypothetical protein